MCARATCKPAQGTRIHTKETRDNTQCTDGFINKARTCALVLQLLVELPLVQLLEVLAQILGRFTPPAAKFAA